MGEYRAEAFEPTPQAGSAPKPKNFEAMTDAYRSGDPVAIAREVAVYEQQLRDVGYEDEWTRTGRVDHRIPRLRV